MLIPIDEVLPIAQKTIAIYLKDYHFAKEDSGDTSESIVDGMFSLCTGHGWAGARGYWRAKNALHLLLQAGEQEERDQRQEKLRIIFCLLQTNGTLAEMLFYAFLEHNFFSSIKQTYDDALWKAQHHITQPGQLAGGYIAGLKEAMFKSVKKKFEDDITDLSTIAALQENLEVPNPTLIKVKVQKKPDAADHDITDIDTLFNATKSTLDDYLVKYHPNKQADPSRWSAWFSDGCAALWQGKRWAGEDGFQRATKLQAMCETISVDTSEKKKFNQLLIVLVMTNKNSKLRDCVNETVWRLPEFQHIETTFQRSIRSTRSAIPTAMPVGDGVRIAAEQARAEAVSVQVESALLKMVNDTDLSRHVERLTALLNDPALTWDAERKVFRKMVSTPEAFQASGPLHDPFELLDSGVGSSLKNG